MDLFLQRILTVLLSAQLHLVHATVKYTPGQLQEDCEEIQYYDDNRQMCIDNCGDKKCDVDHYCSTRQGTTDTHCWNFCFQPCNEAEYCKYETGDCRPCNDLCSSDGDTASCRALCYELFVKITREATSAGTSLIPEQETSTTSAAQFPSASGIEEEESPPSKATYNILISAVAVLSCFLVATVVTLGVILCKRQQREKDRRSRRYLEVGTEGSLLIKGKTQIKHSSKNEDDEISSTKGTDPLTPGDKYFRIRSQWNSLVLGAEKRGNQVGTKIVTQMKNIRQAESQLFYVDPMTGTIRLRHAPLLALDDSDGILKLKLAENGWNQKWKIMSNGIVACGHHESGVLSLVIPNNFTGTELHRKADKATLCQRWSFEPWRRLCFLIRNNKNKLVLATESDDPAPGNAVICVICEYKDGKETEGKHHLKHSQLWYEDSRGFIRSYNKNLVFDTSEEALRVKTYDPDAEFYQSWCRQGEFIKNPHDQDKVIGVQADNKVQAATLNDNEKEKWTFEEVNYNLCVKELP